MTGQWRIPAVIIPALAGMALLALIAGIGLGWDHAIIWIMEQQRHFHRHLAISLRQMATDPGAIWALTGISFAYGVFHAAGPGHGKAVIATYLLTQESRLTRGITLAAASALAQGLVAVILVGGLRMMAGWMPITANAAAGWSERASFFLLSALGAWFVIRAVQRLRWTGRARTAMADHANPPHEHGPGCGCAHGPSAQQINAPHTWRTTASVILSIGLRPCSGAVLVLALAQMTGSPWAGIGAVAAMSAGTAMTVAALALITVKARHWAATILGRGHGGGWAGLAFSLVGGGALCLLGLSLLLASFGPAHPLMPTGQ